MSTEPKAAPAPDAGDAPRKLRLGGMALRNGLLVHGPAHWAAAVRDDAGAIQVASGRKPKLKLPVDKVPGAPGVVKLAEAYDAAQPRHAVGRGHARLAPRRGADLPAVVADRGGPRRRPVDEQPVAQGHPAEAELVVVCVLAHPSSLLVTSAKHRVAHSRSRTSMRSSAEWMSGEVS